jgi:hypothetical protein
MNRVCRILNERREQFLIDVSTTTATRRAATGDSSAGQQQQNRTPNCQFVHDWMCSVCESACFAYLHQCNGLEQSLLET